ncbi:MAG: response regulator [Clostridia bacterium]|nr:response regulator [Clostridia bacterium]
MKKILIVDDAAFMRVVLKNILVKEGFEVVGEASNGIEALEQYDLHKPDIVTMDITMPEMDGIVATKELMKKNKNAKVCMVSAMGQEKIIIEAIKNGAKDFIVKPFKPEEVLEKIKKLSA